MRRGAVALLFLGLAACATPSVEWQTDHDAALAQARRREGPLLIFFRSSWDTSSVELERVFTKPRIAGAMAKFVALRIDMTTPTDAASALLERYGQLGPPAVLVLCPGGQRVMEIHQAIGADEMLLRIRQARRTCAAHRQRQDH